jgi:hypothetical protein
MSRFKKLVAIGVMSTLIMGSSITAFASSDTEEDLTGASGAVTATEQTVTGTGTEDFIFKKVFKVTVPTSTEAAKLFSFYSDPQGLIAETNAAQIGTGVTITEDTGIFFKNTGADGKVSLSSWSDPLKIVNKSTSGVEIAISAQLKPATSDAYAGGYSETADFKDTDSTKGLYLALWTTGSKENTALEATAGTINNYAKSAYSLYKVTYDNNQYKFEIPAADLDKAPVYEVYANGALNKQLADTTWYKVTENQPLTAGAALAMPDIEVKYTPKYIDAKPAKAEVDKDGIWIWNADDTPFVKDSALTACKVNDVAVSLETGAKTTADGYANIPMDKVYTALGLTEATEKTLAKAKEMLQGVEISVGGVALYANVD